jgi:hypothetical protein
MTHTVDSALRSLSRKSGLKIENTMIRVLKSQNDVGIKSWGKIDYLRSRGYGFRFVKQF